MVKVLTLLLAGFFCLFSQSFAQDGNFNSLNFNQITKGAGGLEHNGWGINTGNTQDARPNYTGGTAYMINNHYGLTFSAHTYYGGIRFYNQGYPTGPFDAAGGGRMVMSIANNSVGIGTTNPRAPLDVSADISGGILGSVLGRMPEGDGAGEGTFLGVRGFSTRIINDSKSFALEHSFYGVVNSSINFFRGGDKNGGCMAFNTDSNIERMRIDKDGKVGIGTSLPQEMLSVNGKIRAHEIKVEIAHWPDYVFEEDYQIFSLAEIEQYIKTNKHLPDMPTAQNVKEDGISVGEMNAKLLKKIEELTLYVIDLKHEVDALKKQKK